MKQKKRNHMVYETAKKAGVFLWEIAEQLGLRDAELSRMLRKELTEAEKSEILRIIEKLGKTKDEEAL